MQEYNHDQTTPSSSWVINHNLNSETVVVGVFTIHGGERIVTIPHDITYTTNSTTIYFNENQVGSARILI